MSKHFFKDSIHTINLNQDRSEDFVKSRVFMSVIDLNNVCKIYVEFT